MKISSPSLLRAALPLLLAVLISVPAICVANGAPPEVEPARWSALSDTLFTHHTDPDAGSGTAIVQDNIGFIWLGTQSGLVRWDGYRFRRYAADTRVAGSLPDSFILALHIDVRGRLWVGTSAGGLARYDATKDSFVVVTGPSGTKGTAVLSICDDSKGGLWVGTERGLDHLDFQHPEQLTAQADGLPDGAAQAVLKDREGTLWVGTRHGLWKRPAGANTFTAWPLVQAEESEPAITRLYQDSTGRIWIGTHAHGAYLFEAGVTHEVRETATPATFQSDSVLAITEATAGEVWLGTDGDGIVAVDAQSATTRRIHHYPDTPTSLSDDYVYALYRDRSGLVWAANIGAISQHDPQQQAVVTLFGGTGRPNGISGKKVFAVHEMPDHRIWLGVGGGVDIIDPMLGRVAQLLTDPTHPDTALPKGRVQTFVLGLNDAVYIATQQGLYVTDVHARPVRRLELPGRSPTAGIRALSYDAGILWVGGDQDGLWKVDLHTPAHPVILNHISADKLGDARITTLNRVAGTTLWVGTRSGLAKVDVTSGEIERVPANSADPTQLLDGFVAATLVDHRGRFWVASFGSGVQVLESRDRSGHWRFRRLGLREGLPHLGVDKLLEDSRGNIWASTDNGLAVINGDDFTIQVLQRPQGVAMRTFWTDSGVVTSSGEIVFGANGGLTIVRPEHITAWTYRPPVVVTSVETSADKRSLKVEFAALDYSSPEHNRYAYRLLGFDPDWIATDPSVRLASYTNLAPGEYTLELRGSNRDGRWSAPLRIPVVVPATWYQTFGFKTAVVLVGLVLVSLLVQVRTLYLRQRQRELQALVNERTAELEKRSNELRDSQQRLEQIAYNDALTGLPNRRLFEDDLKHSVALAKRDGPAFTLLLVDLDGFKKINDTLGHDAGDALLVEVSRRLKQAVREADQVARLGGDEFAVILAQTSEQAAVEQVCKRILASVAEPVTFKDCIMRVTGSIGSAQCPHQGSTMDELYKAADTALYDAKRSGRNMWSWYGYTVKLRAMVAAAASGVGGEKRA
ncbi:MAG: diguanylate cyclase [Proteobacteria bacterium]|nr:diguanylate cyclase [Pseudomonadota bacterium]